MLYEVMVGEATLKPKASNGGKTASLSLTGAPMDAATIDLESALCLAFMLDAWMRTAYTDAEITETRERLAKAGQLAYQWQQEDD